MQKLTSTFWNWVLCLTMLLFIIMVFWFSLEFLYFTLRTSTLMYPVARSKNHTTAFSTDYNNKSRSIGVYHAMGAARAWHSHGTREGARLRPGKTLQQSHLKPFIHYWTITISKWDDEVALWTLWEQFINKVFFFK